jgi:1,4-dihydroxy-2-naphthoate octaprenyltransferase
LRYRRPLYEDVIGQRVRRVGYAVVAMSRPPQLLLIGVVYALGTAMALGRGIRFDSGAFLGGLVAVETVAASVHYANEYADYETDRLTTPTQFSGGSQALVETGLSRRVPLWAGTTTLVLGGVVTVVCLYQGHLAGAAAAVLGAIAVLGWQYSVGPLALAWRGLGELDNAFLGGIALPVFGYAVQAGAVSPAAVLATVPFACVVFVNLLDTTWPDREADGAVGKYTLATRWSRSRLRATYALGVGAAVVTTVGLTAAGTLPPVVAGGVGLALPLLAVGYRWYTHRRSPLPTVAAMVLLAVAQLVAWLAVAGAR